MAIPSYSKRHQVPLHNMKLVEEWLGIIFERGNGLYGVDTQSITVGDKAFSTQCAFQTGVLRNYEEHQKGKHCLLTMKLWHAGDRELFEIRPVDAPQWEREDVISANIGLNDVWWPIYHEESAL